MTAIFPRSSLSAHAHARLAERFKISADELLELLNSGKGRKVGRSQKAHLAHRLLWSHVDGVLMVAIQDIADGEVLTVLTLEMYRNHNERKLTESRVQKVLNQMVHAGLAPGNLWKPGFADDQVFVSAHLEDDPTPVILGAWKGGVDSLDLAQLGSRTDFWQWVAQRASEKGADVGRVRVVRGRFTGGEAQDVPYLCAL